MLKISPGSEGTLVLGDKAGQAVLRPGSGGGTRLPLGGFTPVEIDRSDVVD
jgi:hypothetical protein